VQRRTGENLLTDGPGQTVNEFAQYDPGFVPGNQIASGRETAMSATITETVRQKYGAVAAINHYGDEVLKFVPVGK
jgi:hypothetical protein